ncbi:hypothetical protein [Roseateles chitinivorans]|uniref:CIS tube protein n=1 Tax=Roseateles chitinivorans TaxID=2917965 RepID=UPI003D67B159
MPWLPDAPTVAAATFKVLEGTGAGGPAFDVQFNPASLDYTISNEFDDRNGNNGARQFVKKSSAKLTMTLIFDTTEIGASVRDVTANIAGLLEPAPDGTKKFAPKVEFGWGTYSFKGVIEQFKETLDFFSPEGVPLRASINLTLASQEVEFQSSRNPAPAVDRNAQPEPVSAAPGAGAADVANALGDPRAARAIAGANGAASLRFGAEAGLSVGEASRCRPRLTSRSARASARGSAPASVAAWALASAEASEPASAAGSASAAASVAALASAVASVWASAVASARAPGSASVAA